jgi:hypothetical protein
LETGDVRSKDMVDQKPEWRRPVVSLFDLRETAALGKLGSALDGGDFNFSE